MTYQDTADLATDPNYQARLAAAVMTEALGRPGDEFADLIIRNPAFFGVSIFGAPVASAPGFGDKYASGGQAAVTDGDLLSAVQGSWDRLGSLWTAEATP